MRICRKIGHNFRIHLLLKNTSGDCFCHLTNTMFITNNHTNNQISKSLKILWPCPWLTLACIIESCTELYSGLLLRKHDLKLTSHCIYCIICVHHIYQNITYHIYIRFHRTRVYLERRRIPMRELLAAKYFRRKSSLIGIRMISKYASVEHFPHAVVYCSTTTFCVVLMFTLS